MSTEHHNRERGFSLMELLVVVAIMGLVTVPLITTFSKNRTDLNLEASRIVARLRSLQARAASGVPYANELRCGYGLRHDAVTGGYNSYVGPVSTAVNCASLNRNYNAAEDLEILTEKTVLTNPKLDLWLGFPDFFFEPPDPKTYINNAVPPVIDRGAIFLRLAGADCNANPSSCRSICVYSSGNIQARPYAAPPSTCP